MKLGFFRKYDLIWKGALGPFSFSAADRPSESEAASELSSSRPAKAACGPFPAKLIVGIRAPVDPQTGMSVELPLLDRKMQDLLRLLSFSLATETMPDIAALLANILRRLETGLKAESMAGAELQAFHLELQVKSFRFTQRDGVFTCERGQRGQGGWPEGTYVVPHSKSTALRSALLETRPREHSSDLDRILQLSHAIDAPVRYRDWRTRQGLKAGE